MARETSLTTIWFAEQERIGRCCKEHSPCICAWTPLDDGRTRPHECPATKILWQVRRMKAPSTLSFLASRVFSCFFFFKQTTVGSGGMRNSFLPNLQRHLTRSMGLKLESLHLTNALIFFPSKISAAEGQVLLPRVVGRHWLHCEPTLWAYNDHYYHVNYKTVPNLFSEIIPRLQKRIKEQKKIILKMLSRTFFKQFNHGSNCPFPSFSFDQIDFSSSSIPSLDQPPRRPATSSTNRVQMSSFPSPTVH